MQQSEFGQAAGRGPSKDHSAKSACSPNRIELPCSIIRHWRP